MMYSWASSMYSGPFLDRMQCYTMYSFGSLHAVLSIVQFCKLKSMTQLQNMVQSNLTLDFTYFANFLSIT